MMIIEQMKKDRMIAMKERNYIRKGILSVVIADVERKQDTSDASVIKVIQSAIKNNETFLDNLSGNVDKWNELQTENEILNDYLPNALTGLQLETIVAQLSAELEVSDMRGMGKLMGALKSRYSEYLIDGNEVKNIIQKL